MKKKYEKRILGFSLLLFIASFVVLLELSNAWFFDSVVVKDNVIKAGSLEVDFSVCDTLDCSEFLSIDNKFENQIYKDKLWQPDDVDHKYFTVINQGNLPLDYTVNFTSETSSQLALMIDVYSQMITSEKGLNQSLKKANYIGSLQDVIDNQTNIFAGNLLAGGDQEIFLVSLHLNPKVDSTYSNFTTQVFNVEVNASQVGYNSNPVPKKVYQVDSLESLKEVSRLVNSGEDSFIDKVVVLESDLDLSNEADSFISIGSDQYPFKGSFDGQGNSITGLFVNDELRDYVGLFGKVVGSNSFIKNLTIKNCFLKGRTYVGCLAGKALNVDISGIDVDIINIYGNSNFTGGVVGYLDGSINNSFVSRLIIDLQNNAKEREAHSVGGLVGYLDKAQATFTDLSVVNLKIVAGTKVGGLIGYSKHTITLKDCQVKKGLNASNGEIQARSKIVKAEAGGFVGKAEKDVVIENCLLDDVAVKSVNF